MTSVGFGNVAAETDNEKIFTICMMIIAGEEGLVVVEGRVGCVCGGGGGMGAGCGKRVYSARDTVKC